MKSKISSLVPYRFGDLFSIKHGYGFKGEYFTNSGSYILLTPGNFYDEGGFKYKGDKEKYYVGEIPEGFILKEGDLIVAMTEQMDGLLGSSAIVPASDKYLHNQRLGLIVDIKNDLLDKRFLYYLFNTSIVRNQIKASASGTKVRHTSPTRIYEVKVNLPVVSAQHKIADVLSAYDELIEVNTRRIRILEQMTQSVYREWFGKADEKSLPEGWEITKLSEIADVNSTSIKRGNEPEEINYVDIASVSTGRIDLIQPMKFSEAPGRARRIVQHGDVIWSTVRPNRKSYSLILNPLQNMIVSTGFAVLRAKTVPFSYLYLATTTEEFAGYLTNHATGSAYPAVNSSDFEDAEIVLPPKELFKRFDQFATPVFLMRETLLAKNTNLRRTRDLLLPRVVSGEVNVV